MKGPLKFITSVLAGVSLGILFAPKRGKDLRKELSKSSDKMGDFGKQLLNAAEDASHEVQRFLEKKEVRELVESGKAQLQDLFRIAQEKGEKLSTEAQKELRSLANNLEKKASSIRKNVSRRAMTVKKRVQKKVSAVKKSVKKGK